MPLIKGISEHLTFRLETEEIHDITPESFLVQRLAALKSNNYTMGDMGQDDIAYLTRTSNDKQVC